MLRGKADCPVSISTDRGKTWQDCGTFRDGLDLTDRVKGRRQYWLRLGAGPKALAESGLTMTTVCQANAAVMPRLKDGGSAVHFEASGRAVMSAGPSRHAWLTSSRASSTRRGVTLELRPRRAASRRGLRRRPRSVEQPAEPGGEVPD